MPRIYDSTSDPVDFCRLCFPPDESEAMKLYGNLGDGPDGRGNCFAYEAEHPDYKGENYICERCGCELSEDDN